MIRAMGGTGKIVTLAGLVFAFTMASMMVSDLLVVGQAGTTIASVYCSTRWWCGHFSCRP